jgi:hypothetical protein
MTNARQLLSIQSEWGPMRQTLRSDRSHRDVYFLSSNPYFPTRCLAITPLFAAYRTGTCTQSAHFESVYLYVYNVEPSDDAFSSPPTLRLCRQSITQATAYNHPSRMNAFDLRSKRDYPT